MLQKNLQFGVVILAFILLQKQKYITQAVYLVRCTLTCYSAAAQYHWCRKIESIASNAEQAKYMHLKNYWTIIWHLSEHCKVDNVFSLYISII